MLGPGEEVTSTFVASGQARFVFYHNLDGNRTATSLHAAAQCAGEQDPSLFWQAHHYIYENQRQLFSAGRQDLSDIAAAIGADVDAFDQCLDSGSGAQKVAAVDEVTKARGIRGRPVFDINGTTIFGNQSFETFAQAINQALDSQ